MCQLNALRYLLPLLVLSTALLVPLDCQANYPRGFVSDGYKYDGESYWWKGYDAYTRSYYQPAAYYYSCGRYVQPSGYYQYSYSHTYTAPAATPTYKDPDWRAKLLDIAGARDKVEAELRRAALEQLYFSQAIKQLGLEGNFRIDGYGQAVNYGSPPLLQYGKQVNLGSYGAQGQTVYGYSYNTIAQLYGEGNLYQLYQGANRLAENAQKLSGQATSDFSVLVGQEGTNRARIAEILAKGQAAQEYLRALEGSSLKIETKGQHFRVDPAGTNGGGGTGTPTPQPLPQPYPVPHNQPKQMPPAPEDEAALQQLFTLYGVAPGNYALLVKTHLVRDCAGCHSNKPDNPAQKRQDPFLVDDWERYQAPAKIVAYRRVTTTDEDERMPRKKDGGAGPRVPLVLAKLYLTH